jgi:LemA protein
MPDTTTASTEGPAAVGTRGARSPRTGNPVSRFIRSAYGTTTATYEARRIGRSARPWRGVLIVVGSTLGLAIGGLGFYCYNLLVRAFIDVQAGRSRVAVLMQRRNDLTRNLEKAIIAERAHEALVFGEATRQRASQRGDRTAAAPEPNAGALAGLPLDRLLAIAEQYPQVKLSDNMQSLIAALVEVERDLGTSRQKLVDIISVYLHNTHTYPCRWYAWAFGFRDVDFFDATAEAGRLAPAQL